MAKDLIVFEDKANQEAILTEIEWSRAAFAKVVTEWSEISPIPIDSTAALYETVFQPELALKEADNRTRRHENGHVVIEVARANGLYSACKRARSLQYSAREFALFYLDNGQVLTDAKAAAPLINERSLIATSEGQKAFATKVLQFAELFNEINTISGGELMLLGLNRIFNVSNGQKSDYKLNSEVLKTWMERM